MNTQFNQIRINADLYQKDYNLWIEQTVGRIREKKYNSIDWENVAEELESLGKSDKRELRNRLIVLLEHLLKLSYGDLEREVNRRGWRTTIREQRRKIKVLLDDSPSLKPMLVDIFAECYSNAREEVIEKTGLSSRIFPLESPLSLENTLDSEYYPEI